MTPELKLGLGLGSCESEAGGAAAPEWLPEGALIYADFVNGNYWADDAERTASEIFELGTGNGGTQNTITVEGLDLHVWFDEVEFLQPGSVSAKSGILSSLNSVMATGFTVFIEYEMNSDDRDNFDIGGLFFIADTVNPFDATKALYSTASPTVEDKNILITNDYSTLVIQTDADDSLPKLTGTYKTAVSFGMSLGGGLYRTSGSLDGSLPDQANLDFMDQNYSPNENIGTVLNMSLFNAEAAFAGRIAAAIRKLVIFNTPKTEAELQALTA